jgi:hypothetical protein
MPEDIRTAFPFITRDMLAFKDSATFGLRVSLQASENSQIVLRGMTREGTFSYKINPAGNSLIETFNFSIPDMPIALSLMDNAAFLVQGENFAIVSLTINGDIIQQLMSGWVYNQKALSWPVISGADQRPGGGRLMTVTGSNPAAGAECSDTVPNGQIWKIQTIRLNLVTTAVVANRFVHLVINDGTNDIADFFTTVAQVISTNYFYTLSRVATNSEGVQDNDIAMIFQSDIIVPEGFIIKTITTGLDGGDNFAAPIYNIERFFTPA